MSESTPPISADKKSPRPAAGAPPRLSVIVPVHNGALQLSRCLDALRLSDCDGFEVIVVDDCSTDNTPRIVERFGARYLRTPHQMGPGGARNLGVEHASGEIVVFVDADVVVPPSTLRSIVERFAQDVDLAALFGSYDESPAWDDFLSQYKNLMHHYVHQVSREEAVTFWAGCGAMRREIFLQFGGFNTKKYPNPSIEDIELGYRLSGAGRKIRLDKRIQVKHLKKWTVRGLLRADILYRAVPWTWLILKTQNLPRDLNLTHKSQFSSALVGLLVLLLVLIPLSAFGLFEYPPYACCWPGLLPLPPSCLRSTGARIAGLRRAEAGGSRPGRWCRTGHTTSIAAWSSPCAQAPISFALFSQRQCAASAWGPRGRGSSRRCGSESTPHAGRTAAATAALPVPC